MQDYLDSDRLWNIVSKKIRDSDIIEKTSDIYNLFTSISTEYNNKIKLERTDKNIRSYQKTVLFLCKSEIDKFAATIKNLENSVSDVYTKEQLMAERNSRFNTELEKRQEEFRELQPKQPELINFSETLSEHNKDIETLLEAEQRRRDRDINVLAENMDPTIAKEWIQNSSQQPQTMKHNNMIEKPVEKIGIPDNLLKKKKRTQEARKKVGFSLEEELIEPVLQSSPSSLSTYKQTRDRKFHSLRSSGDVFTFVNDAIERNDAKCHEIRFSNNQTFNLYNENVEISSLDRIYVKDKSKQFIECIVCESTGNYQRYIPQKLFEIEEGNKIQLYSFPSEKFELVPVTFNHTIASIRHFNEMKIDKSLHRDIYYALDNECFCVFLSTSDLINVKTPYFSGNMGNVLDQFEVHRDSIEKSEIIQLDGNDHDENIRCMICYIPNVGQIIQTITMMELQEQNYILLE